MAYTLPIGIPDPGFGITDTRPDRPAPWTSDIPGYYYVNNDTGTDSGRTYGNPTAPRATFPRPIPAGSYIEVHGTYDVQSGGTTFIQGNGTSATWAANSAGPVWLVGLDVDNRPTFTIPSLIYGAYIYVEYIIWQEGVAIGSGTAGRPADHIVVRHCESFGDGVDSGAGITAAGSTSDRVSNIVVYDNLVHDLGDMTSTEDLDFLAYSAGSFTSNAWILDNTAYHIVGGCRAGSASISSDPGDAHHLYFGRNRIYDGKQNAITTKYAQNVVYSQNIVSNITDNGSGLSPGKGLAGQYKPSGLWMLFNNISDCRFGIYYASADSGGPWPQYLIGNVITNCGVVSGVHDGGGTSEGAIMMRAGYTHYLVNNTCYNCDQFYGSNGGGGDFHYLENNIFANKKNTGGYYINIENSPDNCTVRNSLLYSTGNPNFRWGGTSYSTLTGFQAGETNGSGCTSGNPQFLSTGNLNINSNSSAINAGLGPSNLSLDLYSLYQATFGIDIKVDYNGISRPQNELWDMGAYEYISAAGLPRRFFLNRPLLRRPGR